jgi:hypothetical protein
MEYDKIVDNRLIHELYERCIVNISNYEENAKIIHETFINNYDDFEHIYKNILNDEYFKMDIYQKYEVIKKHKLMENYSHLVTIVKTKKSFYIPRILYNVISTNLGILYAEQWYNIAGKFEIQSKNYFFNIIEEPLIKSATKLN